LNYFAHGHAHVADPYFLAGTAIPDWLTVADRTVRLRSRSAEPWVRDADPRRAALAAGVLRHFHDDRWFHQTRAFAELSLELSLTMRNMLPGDDGFRPSFLGHVLVEILLDASLIADDPPRLDAYYQALAQVEPQFVSAAVERMAGRGAARLPAFIGVFCAERFLYDYGEDGKLLTRLNHIMRRVRLPPLPDDITAALPAARRQVHARRAALLGGAAG
jgi:hypothetical protein